MRLNNLFPLLTLVENILERYQQCKFTSMAGSLRIFIIKKTAAVYSIILKGTKSCIWQVYTSKQYNTIMQYNYNFGKKQRNSKDSILANKYNI